MSKTLHSRQAVWWKYQRERAMFMRENSKLSLEAISLMFGKSKAWLSRVFKNNKK